MKYDKQKTVTELLDYAITGLRSHAVILLFCYSIILLCFFSCVAEEEAIRQTEKPEQVTLDMPLTRSANDGDPENRISSARLVVLTSEAPTRVLVNKRIDVPENQTIISFRELVYVGFLDLYLIANEKSGWNLDSEFPVNSIRYKADLKAKVLDFSAYPVVDGNNPIPMFGAYERIYVDTDEKIYADNKTRLITLGEVSRLYAKVTLDISCVFANMPAGSEAITLKRVSVKKLPEKSYLSPARYGGALFDGAEIQAAGGNYSADNTGFSGSFTFYIPEYLINDLSNRSYLSVMLALRDDATYPEKEYKLYLGDGIADGKPGHNNNSYMGGSSATQADLSISRNTHYTFTATVKNFSIMEIEFSSKVVKWGETEDVDLTTGNKQLEANSYLMEPGGDPILIPVSRAGINATDDYAAEIVWMEKWDGTSATAVAQAGTTAPIRTLRPAKASTTDLSKNYILVTPGTAEGNAVIAIRKASAQTPNTNPILWTWHLWVTKDKEAIETGAGSKNKWMERPLGSLESAASLKPSAPLYYEWGRRDPFTTSQAVTPTGTTGSWNAAAKTAYDPCPPGWRVPTETELKAAIPASDAAFVWDNTNKGREKATAGGFYPAAGWMNVGGALQSAATNGKYWHSTSAAVLHFTSTTVAYAAEAATNRCNIRCIRE